MLRGTFSGNSQSVGKNACPNDTARKRFRRRPEEQKNIPWKNEKRKLERMFF
jgi:hypothetical protein